MEETEEEEKKVLDVFCSKRWMNELAQNEQRNVLKRSLPSPNRTIASFFLLFPRCLVAYEENGDSIWDLRIWRSRDRAGEQCSHPVEESLVSGSIWGMEATAPAYPLSFPLPSSRNAMEKHFSCAKKGIRRVSEKGWKYLKEFLGESLTEI